MQFPEVEFGSRASMESALRKIRRAMKCDREAARALLVISSKMEGIYSELEPYFRDYIEPFCKNCPTPCCVNRHGFPDFEDLIFLNACGRNLNEFDFACADTDMCQYLGSNGCRLARCARSYRCTWYFCDEVLDRFESEHSASFMKFDELMHKLASERAKLIKKFESLWSHLA
ncbi:MAG: hypothetical protein GXO58_01430 [Thermodesulfobacteria bacterium]|nr:hypothetical protein [Thermodesulfobacteriota bacterium]